jgi:hypothetical protein
MISLITTIIFYMIAIPVAALFAIVLTMYIASVLLDLLEGHRHTVRKTSA